MNKYITLNGKNYRTNARNWAPVSTAPSTLRILLDGSVDVAYGPAVVKEWQGTIEIDQSPASGYGAMADFIAAVNLRAAMPFTDHYGGTAVNVHLLAPGGFRQRALIPMWDSSFNKWFVEIRLVKA